MAWLELHQSAPRNPKILALAAAMSWSSAEALGRIATLWLWALDYAEDGDITRHNPAVIAQAVDLPRERAVEWCIALRECKLVDDTGVIHDWEQYAGRLISSRNKNRDRAKASYVKSTRRLREDYKQSEGLPTQPTQHTQPTQPSCPPAVDVQVKPKGNHPSPLPNGFEEFWASYPKRKAKGAALAWWKKHKPDEDTRKAILAALEWQRESADWTKDGGQYIPMPSTYLNQRRWEDDPVGVKPRVDTSDPKTWNPFS